MHTTEIIKSFVTLGNALATIPEETKKKAHIHNGWFTPEFTTLAGNNWSSALESDKISKWIGNSPIEFTDKRVAIIMAGNIPFVGLHDLLSVLAKGMIAVIKLSSNDEVLMKFAIHTLCDAMPTLKGRIITDGKLSPVDFLIATGSNNSSRYFEYYFKGIPSLIRKNRTSIAVIDQNDSDDVLRLIAADIYTYYGLGCRNVSHLLLPRNMELKRLYEALDLYMDHVNHHKYYNNYMYHKSILLMNLDKHYDNGFMLFRDRKELHAPIATMNYHYYDSMEEVQSYIDAHRSDLQCIVSTNLTINEAIAPGTTQKPELWDYSDNINILQFLDGK